MHRSVMMLVLAVAVAGGAAAQPVTGLSGWDVYLDPGHSRQENQGAFGYSEAMKNLEVGLALREMLLQSTDIDTVYMSRTNAQVEVSLSQRVDHANSVAASHFHSIHSNAAGPSANFVFVLWPQYRDGSEAVPNGGRAMAEIMSDLLGRSMRIDSRGGLGECDFYGVASCRGRDLGTGKGGSRNFVQSFTEMASELSEAGFHTNPTQNQRNMNADWKRLEARAMYWSILEYLGVERPPVRTVTGIVSDVESGRPINGAVVTVGDTTYVTDTFASLFHRFSSDPDELRNGFYYLDELPGGVLPVTVEAEGFGTFTGDVEVTGDFFTFFDVQLVSQAPPVVASSAPAPDEPRHRLTDPLVIDFSRPMDRASVEAAFSVSPAVAGAFAWDRDDTRLIFRPDTLLPETAYVVRIGEDARGAYGHAFDGDADGVAGGAYELRFTTSQADVFAPVLTQSYPAVGQSEVERSPVVTVAFDERLDASTVTPERFHLRPTSGGAAVPGRLVVYAVGDAGVVSFFPEEELEGGIYYTFTVEPGLADLAGNATETRRAVRFRTTTDVRVVRSIDPFEPSEEGVWWQPQQSGSTTGIVTDSTAFRVDSTVVNLLTGSTRSRRLDYGWDAEAGGGLIRVYLGGGPARSEWFDADYALQVYLFGDGSGNRFRFAVDDQQGHEVSPWVTVDWLGWRPVTWELSEGDVGTWIGDGRLDAPLRMDSFQLTRGEDAPAFGSIWIDDLRLTRRESATAAEPEAELPGGFTLYPNYPNPFNPSTKLRFAVGAPGNVRLVVYNALGMEVARLADGVYPAGVHEVAWDASGFPSGVYFARMEAFGADASVKLVLMK